MKKFYLLAFAGFCLSTTLSAHASFVNSVAENETYSRLAIKIPHGCGEAATDKLRIILPDGMYMAAPIYNANLKITLKKGPQPSAKIWGKDRSEGVREITYEGFKLPSEMVGEFGFYSYIKTQEDRLLVKVEQFCGDKKVSWEASDHSAAHPAAALKITHKNHGEVHNHDHHHHH